MPYKFFRIPTRGEDDAEEELNSFLGNHRVLTVTREFVDLGENSFWSLCVDYLDGLARGKSKGAGRRSQIDYKEVLTSEEFALFAKLRELRKELAQTEAVPVYTIFTNEQLAHIVQERATSTEALANIAGLGDARIAKYGSHVLSRSQPPIGKKIMKRTGRLFERIVDRENLRHAFHAARRGKRGRPDTEEFAADLEANLWRLASELQADCCRIGRYRQFTIRDPKQRIITAPCFSERVLHHAIMNVCEPEFERFLIADTFVAGAEEDELSLCIEPSISRGVTPEP